MKEKSEYKKGLWTKEEDRILLDFIRVHGKGKWNRVAKMTGLKRCGKSCRLRWINYLSPSVKQGDFSEEEEDLIIRLHNLLGNRWSLIAGCVPGRTDNQVKNHWNTHLSKKLGFKKHKCSVNKYPSSESAREEKGNTSTPRGSISNKPRPSENENVEDIAEPISGTLDGSSREATIIWSDLRIETGGACNQMGSFSPFIYDETNLYTTPPVMEHYINIDECFLDYIWHG